MIKLSISTITLALTENTLTLLFPLMLILEKSEDPSMVKFLLMTKVEAKIIVCPESGESNVIVSPGAAFVIA
jgi:hypothetical protein